jgi:ABC-type transport system substrate-binding protein
VGNGPFVLAEVSETGARLTANPHWRAGSGNVGEVRIVFRGRDDELPLAQWLDGRFDLQLVREAPEDAEDTVADRSPTLSTHYLAFNAALAPMDDERVRRALAHAIDSTALMAGGEGVDLAAGRGGAIPPVIPGHSDGAGTAHDVERARELLAEAGYPGGEGLPELRVDARPSSPIAALARQLEAVGVRVRFETPEKHWGVAPEAHAWFSGWHADYPDPDGFYFGLLKLGLPLYCDDEIDALLERARSSRDRDERLRLYREFEHLWIGARAAIVPISYDRQLVVRRPHVQGLRLNPLGAFHLEQVVIARAAQPA